MKKLFAVLSSVALLTGTAVAGQLVHRGAEREGLVHRSAQREGGSTRESLQGVWQVVEVTLTGPGARTIAIPEPRPNLTIITARHYSRVEVQAEGPRPVLADATKASADELRTVWGPFVGEAGTYEVTSGNLIAMRPIASKNPAVMGPGVVLTYSYKLEGNTLWVTQQRNQHGPFANPVTVKAVRVE